MRAAAVYSGIVILAAVLWYPSVASGQYVAAQHKSYEVVYDYSKNAPAAVIYVLQESDFRGSLSTKPKHFKMDVLLPPPRVRNSVYKFSGYERGHLCAAGDRDSRKDWFNDTYVTSNILPMTSMVNGGGWKDLELLCRRWAVSGHPQIIACGGIWPHFPDSTKWMGMVAVPDSLWKISVCLIHPNEVHCWKIPNIVRPYKIQPEQASFSDITRGIDEVLQKYIESWIKRRCPEAFETTTR